MKKIFVTGAFGTLGTELVPMLSKDYHVLALTRDENDLQFKSTNVTPVLGDIKDKSRLINLTRSCDQIVHLAALKHVDLMEENISECLNTNLTSTQNILAAQEANNIDRVVFISTDKAVRPINAYGLCKSLSEKLVLENINNTVCRYGNVFGSNGSLFKKLLSELEASNTIRITHEEMTRFFISIAEAASFVNYTIKNKSLVGVRVPDMKSANILEMMKQFAFDHGFLNPAVEVIGVRPGEKIHEDLFFTNDKLINSFNSERFTQDEIRKFY